MKLAYLPSLSVLAGLITLFSCPCAGQQTAPADQSPPATSRSAQAPAPAAAAGKSQSPDPDPQGKTAGASGTGSATGGTANGASSGKSGEAAKGTSNDRLFFALPNFLTVDKNGKIIPLTAGQKFKVVARGAFDPVQLPWYGILSAISQAEDSEPGYKQGWEGYGKRLGTYAADGTIENFMVGAVLPSIFHQDPRFFPSGQGSFVHRAGYAVSRIVITRGDSGRREFNVSEVLGSAMSSAISTYSYHPRRTFLGEYSDGTLKYAASDRTLGNAASVWVSQMGYDAITIALKEFWPDIRRKVKKQPK